MQQTIEKKSRDIQSSLDNLLTRNINKLHVKVQEWMNFTVKQVQQDLVREFVKAAVSDPVDWLYIQEHGKEMLKPVTLEILESGGNKAYDLFKIKEGFDALSLDAVKAADEICGKLVVEVTKETRKGIRFAVKEGLKEGKSMDKIAREIRPLVGLTERQTQSIYNYKTWLREKRPELSAADVDKRANTYAGRTHRRRAMTIARTEAANAQNVGYVQGLENTGIEQVEFLPSAGACSTCKAMRGNKYDLDKAKGIIAVHPNCRCAMLPVIDGVPACGGGMKKAKCIPPENLHDKEVDDLLNRLKTTSDVNEQENIRRALQRLDYKDPLPITPKPKLPPRKVTHMKEELKTQKAWEKSLTNDEREAITGWSAGGYQDMRFLELGGDVQKLSGAKYHTEYLKEQLHAVIERAPNYKGVVYRGGGFYKLDIPIEAAKEGQKFIFNTTSSFSKNLKEAEIFARGFKKEGAFVLKTNAKTGVDISHLGRAIGGAGENEVLSRKGTQFVVRKVTKMKDYTLIEADEIRKLLPTSVF